MSKIRLYGCTLGHGSWATVTAGVRRGLEAHGLFAGLVPIDAFDDDALYPGQKADVALIVGPSAEGLQLAKNDGFHDLHLVLLAPNSSWLPEKLVRYLVAQGAVLGAPSAWGASVIDSYLAKIAVAQGSRLVPRDRAWVYPHGVDPNFSRSERHEALLDTWYDEGKFRVLHLSSTTAERKGTRELVVAWHELLREGAFRPEAVLEIVYNGAPAGLTELAESLGGPSRMLISPPWSAPPAELAEAYRMTHVVCQPSRGEGFGLVPLEAAASGTVVVATEATGHAEYMHDVPLVRVATGPDAPIDDGPGALAPAVTAGAVKDALRRSYAHYLGLRGPARLAADRIREAWAWEKTTERFVRELKERTWI